MKDNKIDFEKCNAEFFEENLHKIETTKFDDYNAWLGAMWRFKSLGISNHAINEWCRRSSKYDQKVVDKVLAERTKGKDNFEQSAKWFAKEAQIQLPQVEKKAFDWNEIPEKTLIGRYEFHKVNNDYIPLEINLKQKPEISKIKTVMKKLYGEHKRLPLIVDGDRKCGTNSEWQLGTVEEIIDVAQQMQDENIRTPKGVTFKFNPFNVKKVEVDDEGLLKTPIVGLFETPDGGEYAGNGLIVGFNDDGDWISHKLNFETVKNSIRFIQYIRLNGTLLRIVLQPSNVKR